MLIVVIRPHRGTCQMKPVATDGVVWSVSLSVMTVHPAKVAEPTTVLFGTVTCVESHVFDGGPGPHAWRGSFEGENGVADTCPYIDIFKATHQQQSSMMWTPIGMYQIGYALAPPSEHDWTVCELNLLWPPYVIGQAIIFLLCGFYLLLSSFFPSLNLSGQRLDVYHTSTYDVALV